jgi:hypothetical protein
MTVHDLPRRDPAEMPMPADPPAHLSAEAAAFWRETVPHAHWLRLSDSMTFELLAELVARYHADREHFEYMDELIASLHKFGLTPLGRAELRKLGIDC